MRCFIASFLDEEIKKELRDAKFLEKLPPNWRKTQNQKIHLSYLFLGNNIKESQIEQIIKNLEQIPKTLGKIQVKCSGLGAFPSPRYASVLWLGAKGNGLEELANLIRQKMKTLSIEDTKAFVPHITIARSAKKSNLEFLINNYKDFECKQIWQINSFELVESLQTSLGYVYKTIKKFEW